MKIDRRGVSTTEAGREEFERFAMRGRFFFQYDFRTPNGELFSCVAPTLIACRCRRDSWLERQTQTEEE